ncbi:MULTISPECIES: GntP family permease [Rhodococcus]|jgi:GntP family gluconate:H+ symporter|uniref:GntP family permease n=1 Tax=Rhodococcus TaxID=1827 RepID=UPI001BD19799|nr:MULTISPECIES: gluconate:H+ symporter [Rhodococcus]MDV7241346.1 gluconate:H+ symporter [Rhodococcus oxybenzonivorans]MDV7274121.1 gluconate:H+ symporter [Rhodococcus oxybenzonivorans]MDV7333626.1 gluconate:H+ symporter [Rhodococcus oxybenzonivorans]MDV7343046.1 gluconate:H+ symporter [Rhodococcus oxybenzonivorans]MDV8028174.1 gluconate:H+ symporter [Rhodococcus sp. IEGM 27]
MGTASLLAAADSAGHDARLITAAVVGVAAIIAMITWLKLHPFLALAIGAVGVGIAAGLGATDSVAAFVEGFGATMGSVGILIGFGAMFGKLLADSGGADRVVDTLVGRSGPRTLPWMMALVGAVIGLPMFFEIGLVLLMPVIILVARRSGLSLMRIAIPTLAGLSAMHGLVPPHPGPLVAVSALNANLGLTLALGVVVAIPTVIVAGPLFSKLAARWVDVPVPELYVTTEDLEGAEAAAERQRPGFAATLAAILLPVVLMLGKAIADVIAPDSEAAAKNLLDFLGTPVVALGLAVLAGMALLGRGGGMDRKAIASSLESSLPPIAGILLIVGAGGGFKQVLIDTGIADVIAEAIKGSALPVLFLAWLVAVLIRVATGSATVATVTASGILAPVAAELTSTHVSLMVLAIGSGSLFLSHVNDAGFWLVKEYLGVTVVQNLKTWTVMECIISVTGLAGVLALSAFI